LKLLAGLVRPTSGEVIVAGDRVDHFNEMERRWLRRSMGLMMQDGRLLDDRTVHENVMLPALAAEESYAEARRRIEEITAEVEAGQIYEGTVTRLLDFGAIVQLLPGKDGLLHISQIANERVNAVSDYLKEGQKVRVKVIEADEKGRVRLSMKALLREEGENK